MPAQPDPSSAGLGGREYFHAPSGLILPVPPGSLLVPVRGGSNPRDPVVFGIIPVLLVTVAALGLWIPSRRASRVDPMAALRSE